MPSALLVICCTFLGHRAVFAAGVVCALSGGRKDPGHAPGHAGERAGDADGVRASVIRVRASVIRVRASVIRVRAAAIRAAEVKG